MTAGLLLLLFGERTFEYTDQRFKSITCDQCQTQYGYVMSRSTLGHAFAWFHLFKKQAQQRAMRKAHRQMNRLMEQEAELVPCPQCMWISQPLVKGYTRRFRIRRIHQLMLCAGGIVVCLFAGVGAFQLLDHYVPHRAEYWDGLLMMSLMLLGILTPLWVHLALMIRRWRFNPNRGWPDRAPVIPKGTPLPILEVERDDDLHFMEEVLIDDEQAVDGSEGVTIDLARFILPRFCCQCMEPADDSTPILRRNPASLYWCEACQRAFKRRRAIAMMLPVLISVGLIAWVCYQWWPLVSHAKGVTAVVVLLFLANTGLLDLIEFMILPCRVKWVDKHRNIVSIRSVNPQYNQLLQDMATRPMEFVVRDDDEMV